MPEEAYPWFFALDDEDRAGLISYTQKLCASLAQSRFDLGLKLTGSTLKQRHASLP